MKQRIRVYLTKDGVNFYYNKYLTDEIVKYLPALPVKGDQVTILESNTSREMIYKVTNRLFLIEDGLLQINLRKIAENLREY